MARVGTALVACIIFAALVALDLRTVPVIGVDSVASSLHVVGVAAPPHAPGVSAFVALESSTPVFDVLYRYGQNTAASNGAYGPNITAPRTSWYVEYQRAGGTDVIAGVLRGDTGLIDEGLKMFHFALAREARDGSFPGSHWPFHGNAFVLSEAAPALVFLRASAHGSRYSTEIDTDAAAMRRAAYSMVRSVGGAGHIDDATKNHRRFEAAIALGAVGVLAHDATLRAWSTTYAWQGIHMERPNGVMPEDGGHDSGYQALGMVNASRYLQLVANGSLHAALYTALQKGEAWELSRIAADGIVDQTGDTRTAGCRERDPTGACKTVFYAPIFSALAHWAAITGKATYARMSHQVWLRSGYGGH
jgi:hypothetical protein